MNKLTVSLAVILSVFASGVRAQNTPPPPTAPFPHRQPAVAQWSVVSRYLEDKKNPSAAKRPASERVIKVTVSKNKTTFHEQIFWSSGKTAECWIYQGLCLGINPGSTEITAMPLSSESGIVDYRHTDFPELAWLNLDSYRGVADFEGKPAHLFSQNLGGGRKRVAWLATDTQLPLFASDSEVERSYLHHPAPNPPPVPPDQYLKLFAQWEKHLKQLSTGAARP